MATYEPKQVTATELAQALMEALQNSRAAQAAAGAVTPGSVVDLAIQQFQAIKADLETLRLDQ